MSSCDPSDTENSGKGNPFPLISIGSLLMLAAVLLSGCGRDEGDSGSGPDVNVEKAMLTVTSEIPAEIYAESLEILGTARTGDTVRAFLAYGRSLGSVVAEDGRFRLTMTIPGADTAVLILQARGRDGSRSDSLRFPIVAPRVSVSGIPTEATSKDSLLVQIQYQGYDSIRVTLNGDTRYFSAKDGYLNEQIPLQRNALNALLIRGIRNGMERGDSLNHDILHDGVSPKLISQTLNFRNRPATGDTTVTLVFDDSVRNLSAQLSHPGYSSDVGISFDRDYKRYYFKFYLVAGDSASLRIKGNDRAGNPLDTLVPVRAFTAHVSASDYLMAALPSHRDHLLYFPLSGGGKVLVLDTRDMRFTDSIPLPAGNNRLVVNPWNKCLYVAVAASQSISVIDPETKAEIRSVPIPEKFFQGHEIRLAFRSDGMGFLSIGNSETIYLIEAAKKDTLYKASLFVSKPQIISTGFQAYDSSRAILISRGWGTFQYYTMRAGDTAVTPVPVPFTDRYIEVWGVNPHRDMIGLSDQRLIDSKGKTLGGHLFNEEELLFGIDAKGRDYLIRRRNEVTQIDRFLTTGLSELRIRGGVMTPIPGTDRLLVTGNKELWEIDLNQFQ